MYFGRILMYFVTPQFDKTCYRGMMFLRKKIVMVFHVGIQTPKKIDLEYMYRVYTYMYMFINKYK